MAKRKKKKKNKRRRHQVKKSKRGQNRERKEPGGLPSKDSASDSLGDINVVSMQTVSRDGPVVEDGYRVVGPAQAMMDYARPLIDESLSAKQMNKVLSFAQLCWTLAIFEREDPEEFERQRKEIVNSSGMPDVEDMIDMMVERYHLMFPDTGGPPSFYIKERVIDIEEYEPFDESTLHISEDRIPPTKKEIKLAEELREIDPSRDEAKLSKWQSKVVDCYAEWCVAKGVPDGKVGDFTSAVSSYVRFLSDYYEGIPSNDMPTKAVQEFMRTFFIRKTWDEAKAKTVMPCALKLFMQYLDEKDIVKGTGRVRKIMESEQDTFQKNLKLYTDPSLGGKIIPFRGRTIG